MKDWASGKTKSLFPIDDSSRAFFNRVMILKEDISVISFIKELSHSYEIIRLNMSNIRDIVSKEKNIDASRKNLLHLFRIDGKSNDVIDMYKLYKNLTTDEILKNCPMMKRFKEIVDNWKVEMVKLTTEKLKVSGTVFNLI